MSDKIEISGDLHPGLWAGIPYYIESIDTTGGRKATKRPIVNSDAQRVSDTGEEQPSYVVTGWVSARYQSKDEAGSPIEQDYRTVRREIMLSIRSGTPGILQHPWEGEISGLICVHYALNETIRSAGMARLTLTFEVDTDQVLALTGIPGPDDVELEAEAVFDTFVEGWVDKLKVDITVPEAFTKMLENAQAAYAEVKAVADTVESVAADITGFAAEINSAVEKTSSLLLTPIALANSFKAIFTSVANIFPTFEARFDAMVNGFDFGDTFASFNSNTYGGQSKQRNQDGLTAGMQGMFLVEAYRAGTGLELLTLDDVAAVEAKLDAQHEKLVSNPDLTPDEIDGLHTLRSTFNTFLGEARITALEVTEADVPPHTIRTLSYALYGDDANAVTLAEINGVEKFELLEGKAQVLSS